MADLQRWARIADGGGWRGNAVRLLSVVWPKLFFAAVMRRQRGMEPCCTLSFDIDFPRDVEALPGVLDVLESRGVRASFACIGQWVRQFPQPHRALVAAGHEIINHSETHPNLYLPAYEYCRGDDLNRQKFNEITPDERRQEIERGHATLVEILDYAPVGFRTPHFGALHVDDVYDMLADLGYTFSTSMKAANSPGGGVPYRLANGIWEFPISPCPLHPLGVFDTWHAIGKRGAWHSGPGQLAALAQRMCECISRDGGYFNLYFDPKDGLESGELARLLDVVQAAGVPVQTYGEMLDHMPDLPAASQ
jgi:peptidoglycan-N-acetylglucosamine deacetylase